MVIVTRSAYKKASESLSSSDISYQNIIPPWCSSGKVRERRKSRKLSPSWEIQSSYPLRENIWEYLYADKDEQNACKKNRRVRRQREMHKRCGKTTVIMCTFLFVTVCMMASLWITNSIPKFDKITRLLQKDTFTSLLDPNVATAVDEECCFRMRYLAAELSRVEKTLRSAIRVRRAAMLTSQSVKAEWKLPWPPQYGHPPHFSPENCGRVEFENVKLSHTRDRQVTLWPYICKIFYLYGADPKFNCHFDVFGIVCISDNHLTNGEYIQASGVTIGRNTVEWGGLVALWGIVPLWRAARPPHTVLALRRPTPADCWPFSGSQGELIVELPTAHRVRGVSIEHVRPDAAKSAPKHFNIYGISENNTWIRAAKGEYRSDGPPKQFYPMTSEIPLKLVVFRVLSNQGNPKYTCLYRFHVYGVKDIFNIF